MNLIHAPRAKTASREPGRSSWKPGLRALVLAGFAALLPQISAAAEDDAVRLFRTLDLNADKQVDRDEFNIQEMEIFYHNDANRDGFLVVEETLMSQASFATVDEDKDGKLSGYEFIDSKLTDFDEIDSNGNGILTSDEFEAFLEAIKNPD